jgi:four helix bundle protein
MATTIASYRDLRVWQEAMALAEDVFRLAARMPRIEGFGLADQMRRSAISIPANIAEGYGRESTGSYVQFLKVARGSLKELETHVLLAQRVGIVDGEKAQPLLSRSENVGKMLNGLIRSVLARRAAAA